MAMSKLRETIESVFDEKFDEVAKASHFREIESWDSLSYIKLVVAIQAKFGIELTAQEIQRMTSVPAIDGILRSRGLQP
jgi:acyl carrier protein